MNSDYFSNSALKAVNRLGDIVCPGDEDFPSFSKLGCIEHIDVMLECAPAADIKDLNMLMGILSVMPTFVLRWVVREMMGARHKTGGLSGMFRMLDIGLRGIILGTYYSGKTGADYKGKTPFDVIGYQLNRITD